MTTPARARPIRLLLVEDVPADAELALRRLRTAGLDFESRIVDSADAFRREVAALRPDIILSDYSMPQFDGLAALALARSLCPDTPFIFVSGTLGEDHAISALKSGAADYVIKNNLLRLPSAVERALQEAEAHAARRRAEAELQATHERLDSIVTTLQDVLWSASLPSSDLVYVSPAIQPISGYPPEAFLADGGLRARLIHADDRARVRAAWQGLIDTGEPYDIDYRIVRADGRPRWLNDHGRLVPAADGRPPRIDGIARDITEHVEQRLRIARLSRIRDVLSDVSSTLLRVRERQPLFAEACRIAVEVGGFLSAWVGALDHGTLEVRPIALAGDAGALRPLQVARISARADDESGQGIVGRSIRTRQVAVWNDVSADPGVRFRELFLREGSLSKASFPLLSEGEVLAVLALTSTEKGFFDLEELRLLNEVAGNIGFALDLIAKQERVNYLAYYDVLTDLPNRALFQDRLRQAVEATRQSGGTLALMVFDIERFQSINDSLGRQAGDELLRQVAQRLRGWARDAGRLGRLGADRFAVLFPAITDAADVLRDRGMRLLEEPFTIGDQELRIAARAGIALAPSDATDADTLFLNAEAALKRARESGERYVFYARQMNARLSEQFSLENKLRKAIELQQFVLHFQPKVDLETRRIVGLEALLRWDDPEQGLVAPDRFVPVLEATGMILPVGQWAMEQAVRTFNGWTRLGLDPPPIAVNVSARQLRQQDWAVQVERCVALLDGDRPGLDLEITESLLVEDVEGVIAKLKLIHALGVGIAIDDFGTGYSSLGYISRLPVDALKIDRSFVTRLTADRDQASLVAAIIMIAHSLRLKVIAEGVETEEQAQMLRMLLCDQLQGWLTGRALPADQIEPLLGRRSQHN